LKMEKAYAGALNKKPLDSFYKDPTGLSAPTKKNVTQILNDLVLMSNSFPPLKRKVKKGMWQTLCDLIYTISATHNCKIHKHKEFFEWFLKTDLGFRADSQNVAQKDLEEKSYTYWTQFYNKENCYQRSRDLFEGAFLESDLVKEGVVNRVRTSSDAFTWLQKRQAWFLQDGKDRAAEDISVLSLYLGDIEADHMKSIADGGITDISNCELMTREANRAKGTNSNEPHFPHQR